MNTHTLYNVLLIAGGWSPEREVSLLGAKNIQQALEKRGHTVTFFDMSDGFRALVQVAKKTQVVFINLHGSPGEDGIVQAFLEKLNVPYQGSNSPASALALNKAIAKALFSEAGLKTPEWAYVHTKPDNLEEYIKNFIKIPFPVFVKANNGGSSINLFPAYDAQELKTLLENLLDKNLEVIVEKYIKGKEVTCGVLGDKALPPILILPKGEFFDYANKYAKDGATEICPAPIGDEATKKVQEMTYKAHKALGLSGYSRADFIMNEEDGEIYLLEINTLPGMTGTSLVPQEAAVIGLSFGELLENLLKMALEK